MMRIIDALIFPGAGVATKNLRHQLPELIKQFPEIQTFIWTRSMCYWATR
jgi:hypothetical protein